MMEVSTVMKASTPRAIGISVILQNPLIMPVDDGEEEILALTQILFDTVDDHGAVRIANLLGNDADGVRPLQTQGASEEIGAIVELPGSL